MMRITEFKKKQSGLAVVEFTIVATFFLVFLFAIFEFGRFLFSLQMLNEVTRKAARLASVCYIVDKQKLGDLDLGDIYSRAPIDLSNLTLSIDYLNDSGTEVTIATYTGEDQNFTVDDDEFENVRYVRARIEGFSYAFGALTQILGANTASPPFETILPRESLGVYRPYYSNATTYIEEPSSMDCQN
ncbi:TadE family protein [Vibrio breoganii]|uniref:TadE family protein n=1 Tax=Vibrio breoganii TaxID=553239 RepID=UPI000C848598|nr:TadE/TadG family type IV pilus assembly protein [Vibrio breoganii]PMK32525.1 hypothetical protein BCU03_04800 [Vibrio breoganii]PMK46247.1 hypothetical protein BCU00_07700 [Vibrio breoganii]PMO51309.1 hypothetical protein BCT07_06355 [Vibrio breoganii]TKG27174.1 pilus assembly protein [Vibrio breoganii]